MANTEMIKQSIRMAENAILGRSEESIKLYAENPVILWPYMLLNHLSENIPKETKEKVQDYWMKRSDCSECSEAEFSELLDSLVNKDDTSMIGLVEMYKYMENVMPDAIPWFKEYTEDVLRGVLVETEDSYLYPKTALLLKHLRDSEGLSKSLNAEITYCLINFVMQQHSDGYWVDDQNGELCTTIFCAYAMRKYMPCSAAIDRAIPWILEHRNADGSWGANDDRSLQMILTPMATELLLNSGCSVKDLDSTLAWIRSAQEPYGLWEDGQGHEEISYCTFLMLDALQLTLFMDPIARSSYQRKPKF